MPIKVVKFDDEDGLKEVGIELTREDGKLKFEVDEEKIKKSIKGKNSTKCQCDKCKVADVESWNKTSGEEDLFSVCGDNLKKLSERCVKLFRFENKKYRSIIMGAVKTIARDVLKAKRQRDDGDKVTIDPKFGMITFLAVMEDRGFITINDKNCDNSDEEVDND